MRTIKKWMPRDHNLILCGDDHTGSRLRHNGGWNRLVEVVNSEYEGCSENFVVHHGDAIEGILLDDRRFDGKTTAGNVLKEIDWFIANIEPIKDRMLVLLDGNHPRALWRTIPDVTRYICERTGIPFGTWETRFTYTYKNGKTMYKHLARHGSKSINSTADDAKRRRTNMELILKRQLRDLAGDCMLMSMGHTHQLLLCRPIDWNYLYTGTDGRVRQAETLKHSSGQYIAPEHRWYVNTGSFLKSRDSGHGFDAEDEEVYSGYAEVAGYRPVDLGFAVAIIRDGKIQDVVLERV